MTQTKSEIPSPADCQSLADVRAAIDAIDQHIVALIGQRAHYVRTAARFKTSTAAVQADARVAAMIQRRRAWAAEAGISSDMVESLFRTMVQYFIQEELAHWQNTTIVPAKEADLPTILALQKLAYQSEGERYNDFTIPPLTQTLDEIQEDFSYKVFLKAIYEGRVVGSVRGYEKDGTCHIGRLIVHPEFQNRGMGTRLLQAIEQHFAHVVRFELFTGHKSDNALYLYHKFGYHVFRQEAQATHTVVFLEKVL